MTVTMHAPKHDTTRTMHAAHTQSARSSLCTWRSCCLEYRSLVRQSVFGIGHSCPSTILLLLPPLPPTAPIPSPKPKLPGATPKDMGAVVPAA